MLVKSFRLMDNRLIYGAIIAAGVVLILYGLLPNSGGFDESRWYSFDKAFEVAKKENKSVLVFVASPTCVWCERMKSDVFSDPEVMERLETKYVPAYVDTTRDRDAVMQIAALFGGDFATPAFIIYSPSGKPVDGWVGYMPKQDFLRRIGV
ncbi:MAG: thioredoxin family protein [Archaeoglobi archaeon]|nr:thioredoxin family protein [Archaeoglobi archaeon]